MEQLLAEILEEIPKFLRNSLDIFLELSMREIKKTIIKGFSEKKLQEEFF